MSTRGFQNKIIWITGASSGIGFALVKALLAQGAQVIASARHLDPLKTLKQAYPETLHCESVDVTHPDQIHAVAKFIENQFGKLDIAILNAGNCYYLDMPDFSSKLIRKNFEVNFFGLVQCIETLLPLLKKSQDPYLVGMSSSAAFVGLPRAEGYGAAKSAVHYLLSTLQVTLKPQKIAVSIIYPGFVKTPLTDRNDFAMPFMISAEKSANYILSGMQKKAAQIRFPWPMIFILKFLNCLPVWLRVLLLSGLHKVS